MEKKKWDHTRAEGYCEKRNGNKKNQRAIFKINFKNAFNGFINILEGNDQWAWRHVKRNFQNWNAEKEEWKKNRIPSNYGDNYTGVNIHVTGVSENKKRNRRNT